MLKKSEVLKEGYIKGLRKALEVINEKLEKGEFFSHEIEGIEQMSNY